MQAAMVRLITCGVSLAEGYDSAVFGAVATRLIKEFGLTPWSLGVMATIAPTALVLGAPVAGLLMNHMGRKTILLMVCIIVATGSLIQALAPTVLVLGLGRFAIGFGTGAGLTTVTVYVSEAAPAPVRGLLASLEEIFFNLGMFLAFGVSWVMLGPDGLGWRGAMMVGVLLSLAAAALIPWPWTPESPRYYLLCGRFEDARRTMRELGISKEEAEQTMNAWSSKSSEEAASDREVWRSIQAHRKPFVMSIGVGTACMLTGIAAVHNFAPWILSVKFSEEDALMWATVITFFKVLILFPVTFYLLDNVGRRPLLYSASFVFAVASAFTALAFAVGLPAQAVGIGIGCVLCSYSGGIGPATWPYIAEILPTSIRSYGTGLALMFGRTVACVWMLCFPLLFAMRPAVPFCACAVLAAAACAFYATVIPETRQKSLESIEQALA